MKRIYLVALMAPLLSMASSRAMYQVQPLKIAGLRNVNNSCFINAVTQAIYAMADVTRLLWTADLTAERAAYKEDSLTAGFIDVTRQMANPQNTDIENVLYSIRSWEKTGEEPGTQVDANEFLESLLSNFGSEEQRPNSPSVSLSEKIRRLYAISEISMHPNNPSLFEAEQAQRIRLIVSPGDANIHDCLKNRYQTVDPQATYTPGAVSFKLTDTQNYVICSLERRGHRNENGVARYFRHSYPVTFPLYGLTLKDYFVDPRKSKGDYELIGMILHGGTERGGHYTAYVKLGNQWHFCNDNDCMPLNEEDVFEIATRGYGLDETIVPTTLIYELSKARATYPTAKWIEPKTLRYHKLGESELEDATKHDALLAQVYQDHLLAEELQRQGGSSTSSLSSTSSTANDRLIAEQLEKQYRAQNSKKR